MTRAAAHRVDSTDVAGLRLHLRARGDDPARPPVLMVHGATYASPLFDVAVPGRSWLAALAGAGFAAYALDVRGYGRSAMPAPPDRPFARMDEAGRDVGDAMAWIAARHGRAPALIGGSWGSITTAAWVAGGGEAAALVLYAPIFAARNEGWLALLGEGGRLRDWGPTRPVTLEATRARWDAESPPAADRREEAVLADLWARSLADQGLPPGRPGVPGPQRHLPRPVGGDERPSPLRPPRRPPPHAADPGRRRLDLDPRRRYGSPRPPRRPRAPLRRDRARRPLRLRRASRPPGVRRLGRLPHGVPPPMTLLPALHAAVGADHVLTGEAAAPYATDWTKAYVGAPLAVARPGSTAEVSAVLRACHEAGAPVVPVAGNTGLAGGAWAPEGAVMLSLARLDRIREVRADARVAVVEAGVVLSRLHEAAEAEGLVFPLTFGARGSAMIGGVLSTNAGGSNVLRYGNTRALCLGIEAVLADGRVLDLQSAVHKDNTGYDLKDLMIGAEGTLGVITAATVRLFSKPRAYATATVAAPSVRCALTLLHRLQDATGGGVECFEYMPRHYVEQHIAHMGGAEPFDAPHEVNLLVEVGATAPRDAEAREDGTVPVQEMLSETLGALMEEGAVLDAVVATSEAQRRAMWARREAAGELMLHVGRLVNLDVALPLDRVQDFLERAEAGRARIDPGARLSIVSHLGDGNVHWTVCPTDPALDGPLTEMVEDAVAALGGSFSAEHGIGLAKRATMARRKDPVALDAMRAIKAALDPRGILNPGKVVPG